VVVRPGEWTFCLIVNGICTLSFGGGDLTQDGCWVSYDLDAIFAGRLNGATWSGTNAAEQFRFTGVFQAPNFDSFSGTLTLTDGSGTSVPMVGHYGIGPPTPAAPPSNASREGRAVRAALARVGAASAR
jgi:hypothetical protein